MKISQEVREYAERLKDNPQLIKTGMKQMSDEFRHRGSNIYLPATDTARGVKS